MNFNEETVKKNYVYNGKILNLRRDDVLLPNGESAIREVIEHSGGSSILCVKDGKVLLVKQFRYPYKEVIWEIPAGKKNPDETPEETAIRELEEEGGVRAKSVEKLFEIYPSPAYTEEIIYIFKAIDFVETEIHLDSDEFLTGEWVEISRAKEMLFSGEIKDAKTIIALSTLF